MPEVKMPEMMKAISHLRLAADCAGGKVFSVTMDAKAHNNALEWIQYCAKDVMSYPFKFYGIELKNRFKDD